MKHQRIRPAAEMPMADEGAPQVTFRRMGEAQSVEEVLDVFKGVVERIGYLSKDRGDAPIEHRVIMLLADIDLLKHEIKHPGSRILLTEKLP